ncbi:MAG TPA: cation diffusion facilitator family transporter [Nocardioidaceae bacterium]|jgi:cation diffusion facilitator family transporter|nr:cation diffusion facilitator family transporter [Nocardioidaceae bacterium]
MSAEGGAKAVVAALLANIGIAVLKFLAWALTGASSMLAEAIHSVADSGNQMLLLLGRSRSRRAATREHQFGYGRERYVYAFLVSVVLFSVGGLFALYEAYHKLKEVLAGHPDELLESRWWWVPLVVLGGALVLEGLSFRTAVAESAPQRGSTSWIGFVRSTKSPELPVVLLEDFAALVGLCFALLGVGLSKLTGSGYWDVAGTAAIGLLLVAVAVVLAVETKSLLLGESARPEVERRIREALEATPGVERVIHLRTLHLGPDELLVAAKTGVSREASAVDVARGIDAAERAIRSAEPLATLIYIEPDIDRGEQAGSG